MKVSTRKKLLHAIRLNRPSKFSAILDSEGWPTDRQFPDYHLLVKAIVYRRKRIVHVLLDAGCRVFKKSVVTPLHLAVTITGWSDVVERLLDRGCPVGDHRCRGDNNSDTSHHLAFRNYEPGRVVDKMLAVHLQRESAANIVGKDGLSFLHIACTRPSVQVVERFVELDGNSINHPHPQSLYTPLHYAVEYDQYEVAEFLLQRGADINKKDRYESTPLHVAVLLRKATMIDLLLSYDKIKTNTVDAFGLSHFMIACAGSNSDIVKEYLDLATESQLSPMNLINCQVKNLGNYAGYTPLHFAADFGRTDAIELLLNHGADCCAMTLRGLTVHALARERNHEDACDLLRQHCDVLARCRELRAESPDFEMWGENYERTVLIERTRSMKYLRKTLDRMTAMSGSSGVLASTDDFMDDCALDLTDESVI